MPSLVLESFMFATRLFAWISWIVIENPVIPALRTKTGKGGAGAWMENPTMDNEAADTEYS